MNLLKQASCVNFQGAFGVVGPKTYRYYLEDVLGLRHFTPIKRNQIQRNRKQLEPSATRSGWPSALVDAASHAILSYPLIS